MLSFSHIYKLWCFSVKLGYVLLSRKQLGIDFYNANFLLIDLTFGAKHSCFTDSLVSLRRCLRRWDWSGGLCYYSPLHWQGRCVCLDLQVKESRRKVQDEEGSSEWGIIRNERFCAGLCVQVSWLGTESHCIETSAQPWGMRWQAVLTKGWMKWQKEEIEKKGGYLTFTRVIC